MTSLQATMEARSAEHREALKQLRCKLADDVEVDPDEVARIIRDADIDFETLEGQVETLKQRRRMLFELKESKRQHAQAAKIDEQISQAEKKFLAVQQEHRERIATLTEQRLNLPQRYVRQDLENALRRGANDPDVRETQQELRSERAALAQHQKALLFQQKLSRETIDRANAEIKRQRAMRVVPAEELFERLNKHEEKLEAIRPELSEVHDSMQEIDAQTEDLRERELDPNCF